MFPDKLNLCLLLMLIWGAFAQLPAQKLNPGDGVRLTFFNITDEISGDYFIQQDGNIQLPYIGTISTVTREYPQIRENIISKYEELYRSPELTVQPLFRINILGEVRTPGFYYVTDVERVSGVLALAGGLTSDAVTDEIIIIRDEREIVLDSRAIFEKGNTFGDIGLQSGDRIFIPRSWWVDARNVGVIISAVAVVVTIVSLFVR